MTHGQVMGSGLHPGTRRRFARTTLLALGIPLIAGSAVGIAWVSLAPAALPPVLHPPQNPFSEPKRLLGKVLFFDEQLSSDNTTSCASCHLPGSGGGDPRRQRHPGADLVFNTPDDIFGSPGVVQADATGHYVHQASFGSDMQATSRNAQTFIMAQYSPLGFWDGRASSTFINPQTGQVSIPQGGSLESQAVAPPLSSVEMAHMGRDWGQVATKLSAARPLALSATLPPDVTGGLEGNPSYRELFRRAFGTPEITAERIAFAIATYERTLVPDQTPWDRFQAGVPNALTQGQIQGMNIFNTGGRCNVCHTPGLFTDNTFRNVGLRPPQEDLGRQIVTNNPADRGRFKVPSLRNVGLRDSFMHNGQFTGLLDVVRFYARAQGAAPQFADNRDPVMQAINIPPQAIGPLVDFIQNALTDPRVAAEQFPFDRAQSFTERPELQPVQVAPGVTGQNAITPTIITRTPAMIGSDTFRIGLGNARPGASATLAMSSQPPVNGRVVPETSIPMLTSAGAPGTGVATHVWALDPATYQNGQVFYAQWFVADPSANGGEARSPVMRLTVFCPRGGCPSTCPADLTASAVIGNPGYGFPDNTLNNDDFFFYLAMFSAGDARADLTTSAVAGQPGFGVPNNLTTSDDFFYYLNLFTQGC